jgi:hypothetical protein
MKILGILKSKESALNPRSASTLSKGGGHDLHLPAITSTPWLSLPYTPFLFLSSFIRCHRSALPDCNAISYICSREEEGKRIGAVVRGNFL